MAEHAPHPQTPERYEETESPDNPPNAVINPQVQRSVWWLYVFPLIVVCIVAGVMLLYWTSRSEDSSSVEPVGTSGDRIEQRQEGGGDPAPRPNNTSDEVNRKGGDLR